MGRGGKIVVSTWVIKVPDRGSSGKRRYLAGNRSPIATFASEAAAEERIAAGRRFHTDAVVGLWQSVEVDVVER
jgi:hypothetical protein